MKFFEAFARAIRAHDVDTVFGVMGDANMYWVDAFARLDGGRFIATAGEAGSVLAANGYARVTGRLGVATVTHGPALTNSFTALVESVRDRTPLLLVAGDTAIVDHENFQNIEQREVILSTGAGFERVRSAATLGEDLVVAIRRAFAERRPIVLNVPIDLQWEPTEFLPSPSRWTGIQSVEPAHDVVEEAAGILAGARRPLILAGQGAFEERSRASLVRLARRLGAPMGTTLRARDLFRDEPHNVGIIGTLSHEIGMDVVASADTIIAFGAGLNKWTTAEQSVLRGRRVIQVDIDPAALHRHQRADVAVLGDAGAVADKLIAMLDVAGVPPTGFASPALADRLSQRRDDDFDDCSAGGHVDLRTAMVRLDRGLPAHRTLVLDGGRFIFNAFRLFHVSHPRDFVNTVNFGSIGLGMGNAVGAALGSGKPTLLVTGDGGFMLGGIAEFNTAVRYGLDLIVAVFNDRAYGAEHVQFRRKGMDPTASMFDWPDFAPVADSLGGRGYTVRSTAELDEALADLGTRDRPVLIDIRIDPDEVDSAGH